MEACRPLSHAVWLHLCGALPAPLSYATATATSSTRGESAWLLAMRGPVGLGLGLHHRQAGVIVRELVEVRARDLRGPRDVVVGDVRLDILRAVLELDVHPHP